MCHRKYLMLRDLMKRRWIPEILHRMDKGYYTYTDILEGIDYLSHTELQRKLKILEEYHCVKKTDSGYILKDLGRELEEVFCYLEKLEDKYLVKDVDIPV
ncbi:MAG: winged helix-turn-helix transcriptional regulator [Tissierellia bacterium]|nr:winged helix-turn-helix transcriptional regulator [Tissierellia bacterium]